MDFSGFNNAEQAHMNKVIEKKQVRSQWLSLVVSIFMSLQMQDFLRLYANIVENCFKTCCNDFTSKALSSKEVFQAGGTPIWACLIPRASRRVA